MVAPDPFCTMSSEDVVPFIGNEVVGEIQSIQFCEFDPEAYGIRGPYHVGVLVTAVLCGRDPLERVLGGDIEFNITIMVANEKILAPARRIIDCITVRRESGMAADDCVFEMKYLLAAKHTYLSPPMIPAQRKGAPPVPPHREAYSGRHPDWPELDLSKDPLDYNKPVEAVYIEDFLLSQAPDPLVDLPWHRAFLYNLKVLLRKIFRAQPQVVHTTEVITPEVLFPHEEMISIFRRLNSSHALLVAAEGMAEKITGNIPFLGTKEDDTT